MKPFLIYLEEKLIEEEITPDEVKGIVFKYLIDVHDARLERSKEVRTVVKSSSRPRPKVRRRK